MKRVDERNLKESNNKNGAIHGITRFADLSDEEYKAILGYKTTVDPESEKMNKPPAVSKHSSSVTSVNWAGVYTTDVKDQVDSLSSTVYCHYSL